MGVIVVIVLSAVGFLNFEQNNNTRTEFTPTNAPSRQEFDTVEKFLQQNGTLFIVRLLIQAKDGGSLLRPAERHEALNISHALHLQLKVAKSGKEYAFNDLCTPYCDKNAPFFTLLRMYDSDMRKPTYPVMDNFGTRIFIGNNIFGVKMNNETREIESFTTAVLYYFFVIQKGDENLITIWEQKAKAETISNKYEHLSAGITSNNLVTQEVKRMGTKTAPMITGSIGFMILFVVGTSFRYERRRSKPWEALIGAIIPMFANMSAIGFMSACGLKFQSIVVCTLFLVLAVGCDAVFVMLRAWDMSKGHATDTVTRMALTLQDAGPSVTITSLTNALSFAVDIYTFTPAIQTFSIYSTVAVIVCYFYQLFLFSAVLALSGRREESGKQAVLCCLKADPEATYPLLGTLKKLNAAVIHWWSRTITTWPVKTVLLIAMCFYWYGAFYGLQNMKTDLSVTKIALPDSYFIKYHKEYEKAIIEMQQLTIIVQKPGNLSDPSHLKRLNKMVGQFETTQYSSGPNSTFLWISAYQEFLDFYGDSSAFTYSDIPTFLQSASYSFWRGYVHTNTTACYDNHPDCVKEFILTIGFHTVVNYVEMIPILAEWRSIAANYSDMEVTIYSERAPYADQADQMAQTLYMNVPASLVCMVVVCIIFIPNVISIVCAILSVISISFGVFGYLALWGIDLDPLSLAALLMSIGFSVDYTAHISYHYYKYTTVKLDPTERVEQTLSAIGWPTIQGGLATAFALWPSLLRYSYLGEVFLKTVELVIFLGLVHSMIVLPALLTTLSRFSIGRR
uniref:SSD domain-containing protein n=1 Tax=Plectus sambesii TaxID=2011161 RepID=A0A914UK13_9BILA